MYIINRKAKAAFGLYRCINCEAMSFAKEKSKSVPSRRRTTPKNMN